MLASYVLCFKGTIFHSPQAVRGGGFTHLGCAAQGVLHTWRAVCILPQRRRNYLYWFLPWTPEIYYLKVLLFGRSMKNWKSMMMKMTSQVSRWNKNRASKSMFKKISFTALNCKILLHREQMITLLRKNYRIWNKRFKIKKSKA